MSTKLVVFAAISIAAIAVANLPTHAEDAADSAASTTGLERYAPAQHAPSAKDIDTSIQSNATTAELPDLAATRAAINRQTGSTIELNVSGWVSQQVQVNR